MVQQSTVTVSKFRENCLSEKLAVVVLREAKFSLTTYCTHAHRALAGKSTIHTSPWHVISLEQRACQHAGKDQRSTENVSARIWSMVVLGVFILSHETRGNIWRVNYMSIEDWAWGCQRIYPHFSFIFGFETAQKLGFSCTLHSRIPAFFSDVCLSYFSVQQSDYLPSAVLTKKNYAQECVCCYFPYSFIMQCLVKSSCQHSTVFNNPKCNSSQHAPINWVFFCFEIWFGAIE